MESHVAFLKRLKADVESQLRAMEAGRYRVFEMSPGPTADRTPEQIANLRDQIQQFEEEIKRWATARAKVSAQREGWQRGNADPRCRVQTQNAECRSTHHPRSLVAHSDERFEAATLADSSCAEKLDSEDHLRGSSEADRL
jgi:hypothetical protein